DGGTPWDVRWQGPPFPSDRVSFDPHARVRDMDIEGIDVNMVLPSGGVPGFAGLENVVLEAAMYQAYHRFLADYCAPYPDRLTSVILVSARDTAAAVTEIRRCSREPWPVGIFPICPPEMSLDEPAWEPIWAAAQEHDLTVVIHSFTMTIPYPPGVWDTWDNVFLQRAAGHVWNAQRNLAAVIGAGVLDRYPALRLTSLECGHGWLPSWAARLDELAEMSRHALPPLKQKPSDYIRGPQYFQSIQIYEGEQSLRHAFEALGEDTLMFATDYPHSESWFPKSAARRAAGRRSVAAATHTICRASKRVTACSISARSISRRRSLFHHAFVASTAIRSGARSIDSVSSSRAAPRGSGSLVNQTA